MPYNTPPTSAWTEAWVTACAGCSEYGPRRHTHLPTVHVLEWREVGGQLRARVRAPPDHFDDRGEVAWSKIGKWYEGSKCARKDVAAPVRIHGGQA